MDWLKRLSINLAALALATFMPGASSDRFWRDRKDGTAA
jgi:hypothetical protein